MYIQQLGLLGLWICYLDNRNIVFASLDIFTQATLCYRGICCHRMPVCLSVKSQYCIKTAKRTGCHKTTPHNSPETLLLLCKRFLRNFDVTTLMQRGRQLQVGKYCVFYRSKSLQLRRLTAKNLCPSATVVPSTTDNGALADEYAFSSTTLAA